MRVSKLRYTFIFVRNNRRCRPRLCDTESVIIAIRKAVPPTWRIAQCVLVWLIFCIVVHIILTYLHLIKNMPWCVDLSTDVYRWSWCLEKVTLTFFMKLLISAYTCNQNTETQLLLCCQSLTLNHVVASNSTIFISTWNLDIILGSCKGLN